MWAEILCGFLAFRVLRRFFFPRDEMEIETIDSSALFAVASRLEKLYGGKAFVGLRIPDADTGLRQSIDMVLVTKGEAVVTCVKNLSGFVSMSADGSWICEDDGRQKSEILPDPEIVHHFDVPILRTVRKGCRLNIRRFSKLQMFQRELAMESQSLAMFENCQPQKGLALFVSAFSSGQSLWLVSAEAALAGEDMKTNTVYETGELFELGIQLSYLLLLLGLLGVGTFFVIRQVLVRRELDLSAKELQEQVRSGDASAIEYFELGAVMLRRKFYPAATKYLLQAIDKWDGDDQDLAQVYNALGVSYVRDDKLDKGIVQFETAVKLQPGYVAAWNNLGDAYEKKKEYKSALKAFEEVLLFDPNNKLARPRQDALKECVDMYKGVPVKSKNR